MHGDGIAILRLEPHLGGAYAPPPSVRCDPMCNFGDTVRALIWWELLGAAVLFSSASACFGALKLKTRAAQLNAAGPQLICACFCWLGLGGCVVNSAYPTVRWPAMACVNMEALCSLHCTAATDPVLPATLDWLPYMTGSCQPCAGCSKLRPSAGMHLQQQSCSKLPSAAASTLLAWPALRSPALHAAVRP